MTRTGRRTFCGVISRPETLLIDEEVGVALAREQVDVKKLVRRGVPVMLACSSTIYGRLAGAVTGGLLTYTSDTTAELIQAQLAEWLREWIYYGKRF